ncbi:diguanylate cyclase [Castellaniella sp.]|uniref:diguanylate cyclase n=1 Tax=Castellaniella sp. TaxID=1955812 RepID=UPI00355CD76A
MHIVSPRTRIFLQLLLVLLALPLADVATAITCREGEYATLAQPIELTAAERALIPQAELQVGVVLDAAPLSVYDAATGHYKGIAVDVFCFIAQELGLAFRFLEPSEQDLGAALRAVQAGTLDVLLPLSSNAERERHGLFNQPYYQTHYVVVARDGHDFDIRRVADLNGLRVGYFDRSSIEPVLRQHLAAEALHPFTVGPGNDGIYQALRAGEIDVAVIGRAFFEENRYRNDYFDLQAIYTFRSDPRNYRFYFSPSERNRGLVPLFDRYLAAIDASVSFNEHEIGEEQFIQRYLQRLRERNVLWLAILISSLLLLALAASFWHYRRSTRRQLANSALIRDQQEALERANQQLERLSQTDALTNLYNRRRFDLRSNDVFTAVRAGRIAVGEVAPLSMLLLDLDRFKVVNDRYGHAVGDDYLRKVADVLRQHCRRKGDEVIRYGGEEFLCVLPTTTAEQAFEMAERIRQAVLDLRCPNPTEVGEFLSTSIGVATSTTLQHDPQGLVQAVDEQLYAAKAAGRNRTHAVVLD